MWVQQSMVASFQLLRRGCWKWEHGWRYIVHTWEWSLTSTLYCHPSLAVHKSLSHPSCTCISSPGESTVCSLCLQINGEAIYDSIPWRAQSDTDDKQTWYTASKVTVLSWTPDSGLMSVCSLLQDGITVYAMTFSPPTPGKEKGRVFVSAH